MDRFYFGVIAALCGLPVVIDLNTNYFPTEVKVILAVISLCGIITMAFEKEKAVNNIHE